MASRVSFTLDKKTGDVQLIVEQDGEVTDRAHRVRHDALTATVAAALGSWSGIEEIPESQVSERIKVPAVGEPDPEETKSRGEEGQTN